MRRKRGLVWIIFKNTFLFMFKPPDVSEKFKIKLPLPGQIEIIAEMEYTTK